jgi:hypothetical protein
MTFTRATAAVAVLLAGGLAAQDKGTKGPPAEKAEAKGPALPVYWDKLGLTDEQKAEVLRLTAEYRPKRQRLLDELGQLDAEQARARVAVLTDDQKRKLVDLVGDEPPTVRPVDKQKAGPADKETPKGKAPDK